MSKTSFGHISETMKARDLIFGTGTPYGQENKMFQSGPQLAPFPVVASPTCQKTSVENISETVKV